MEKEIEPIKNQIEKQPETRLYSDVCSLIENTKHRIATTVNAEICMLHWQIGVRIKDDVLFNQRAEYGKQVVKNLAIALTERYGRGWSYGKLKHCVRSAYTFSEIQIGYALRIQLTNKRAIAIARENYKSNKVK